MTMLSRLLQHPRVRFGGSPGRLIIACGITSLLFSACQPAAEREPGGAAAAVDDAAAVGSAVAAERILAREIARIEERADSLDAIFQPLPLLRGGEEAALRRFGNQQQLQRARALGVRPGPGADELARHEREGTLVRLDDSTRHWVVRELDHSVPLVVPSVQVLLTRLGERFHQRLDELGLPAFRMEVTSVLRSAENQAALRRINPNAAAGVSTHEFGTTIDVAYSAFAAPELPIVESDAGDAGWLEPHLSRYAATRAETVAARRSRELQAILGRVLIEMQQDGTVMVTMEQLQPVFHMTVARELR